MNTRNNSSVFCRPLTWPLQKFDTNPCTYNTNCDST